MKYFLRITMILGVLGSLSLAACSSKTIQQTIAEDLSETAPVSGTAIRLSFDFGITLDSLDDGFDYSIDYPHNYDTFFYFDADGSVEMMANDFPVMVYRICADGSSTENCDQYYNPESYDIETEGNDIDIVVDACGASVDDDQCGEDDETVYTGTFDASGTMRIDELSFRVRFFIATEEPNGHTAESSDTGLILSDDSIRLTISKITTGRVTIDGGDDLTATGSPITSRQVILVGGGTIPSSVPALGGSYFIGEMDGTFSSDPLGLLE